MRRSGTSGTVPLQIVENYFYPKQLLLEYSYYSTGEKHGSSLILSLRIIIIKSKISL